MEETSEPTEVTSPDQIARGGLLESGAADRGARAGWLVLVSPDDSLVAPARP